MEKRKAQMYELSSQYHQRSKQYMLKKCDNPVTRHEVSSLVQDRLLDGFGYYVLMETDIF